MNDEKAEVDTQLRAFQTIRYDEISNYPEDFVNLCVMHFNSTLVVETFVFKDF